MGINTTASRRTNDLRPDPNPDRLIERIVNDRFGDELAGNGTDPERERGYRAGWNACSAHVEALARVELGLVELRDALVVRTVDLGGES